MYCDCARQLHEKVNFKNFLYLREYEHGYLFEIKVITHVDSTPTNTERVCFIPVSFRKVIDSRELMIKLKTFCVFSTVHSFHMECKSTE